MFMEICLVNGLVFGLNQHENVWKSQTVHRLKGSFGFWEQLFDWWCQKSYAVHDFGDYWAKAI